MFIGWFLFYHVEGFLNFIYSCYAKPSESHTFYAHTLQFFRHAHSLEVYAVWCMHMIMVQQEEVWSWAQCSVYPSSALDLSGPLSPQGKEMNSMIYLKELST